MNLSHSVINMFIISLGIIEYYVSNKKTSGYRYKNFWVNEFFFLATFIQSSLEIEMT
jgi:hypothetical protein